MSLQIRFQFPQIQEILDREESGLSPGRVKDGRRVTFACNQRVVHKIDLKSEVNIDLLKINLSFEALFGSFTEYFIVWKKRTDIISAIDAQEVG